MKTGTVITFVNQKGGVGKSTTVFITAIELIKKHYSVLVIDLDPQATLTGVCGDISNKITVRDWLNNDNLNVEELIQKTSLGFDIIPANPFMELTENELINTVGQYKILNEKIKEIKKNYNFILIDCRPTLGILTKSGLFASDFLVIPVKPEIASVMGVEVLINTLVQIEKYDNKEFNIAGILLTMVNSRTTSYRDIKDYLVSVFGKINTKIFDTSIRNSVKCSDSFGEGKTIDEKSAVGIDYKDFVEELLKVVL